MPISLSGGGNYQYSYTLSATTTNTTPARLTGDSLALEVGEAWQFEVKLVGRNKKTDATKVWSIRGGIRRGFSGVMQMVGSLDTLTTGSLNGASVEVAPDHTGHALAITVTGPATASVDWQATVLTSEKTSAQQALVGGCTDPSATNYNSNADIDNGSCSFSGIPASSLLVPVTLDEEAESMTVDIGDGDVLHPAFSTDTLDYCVSTSSAAGGTISYTLAYNSLTTTGDIKAGQTLQVQDGTRIYYIRFLPSNVVVGDVQYGPEVGYVPGYYLTTNTFGPGISFTGDYYYIYDKNGVPVWYAKKGAGEGAMSLHAGGAVNTLISNSNTGPRRVMRLFSNSITAQAKSILPRPEYGSPSWDNHEALHLSAPASRRGNVVAVSYDDGFYIQEQSPDGSLVWDWHSQEYFSSTDIEFYHLNSVDVHPVTGDVLVSLRHCSAVLCIDFQTKAVKWVLQGKSVGTLYGTLQSVAIPSATVGTKWLTISGEPTDPVDGTYQYEGTAAQHDARWHANIQPLTAGNDVISVFDNQTGDFGWTFTDSGPRSRGAIYEINHEAGTATHRSSIFSEVGVSGYMGSYSVVEEGDGFSHAVNFVQEHPQLVEYRGAIDSAKTKVFAMDLPGDCYRIVKVPLSFFRADNLRATCGINADGTFPSYGGGGGGGGTALLLHFDGSNGSTTFTDSSPNALTVTGYGDVAISTAQSKFGGESAYFDGDGDYIEAAIGPLGTGDFTAEAWVFSLSDTASYANVVTSRNGTANWTIFSVGQDWNFFFAASFITGSGALVANQWQHIAASRAGGVVRLFVDGLLVASTETAMDFDGDTAVIGAFNPGAFYGDFLNGYIDELRITKGTALYTDDFTPPSAPFTA